jgi:beta-glucanase (GH16 family)
MWLAQQAPRVMALSMIMLLASFANAKAQSCKRLLDSFAFNSPETLWQNYALGYPWGNDHNGSAHMEASGVSLDNGTLVLSASPLPESQTVSSKDPHLPIRYSSGAVYWKGMVTVTDEFPVWRLSGEFSVPTARGTWPAFWITAAKGWPPELDILEYKGDSICWQNTLRGATYKDAQFLTHKTPVSDASNFHRYSVEMSKINATDVSVRYFIDGKSTGQDVALGYVDKPMQLILNLQMEGASGEPGPVTKQQFKIRDVYIDRCLADLH